MSALANLVQGRVESLLCEHLDKAGSVQASWYRQPVALKVDVDAKDDPEAYPITITLEDSRTGTQETIKSKYVVGCDGARSWLRKYLNIRFVGDLTDSTWGKWLQCIEQLGDHSSC